jgi:hypothetical protein
MLAAVEDEQHPLVLQECEQARDWIIGADREAQCRCEFAGHQARIAERTEIDETHHAAEVRDQRMTHGDGDGGFADATRADEGDETM